MPKTIPHVNVNIVPTKLNVEEAFFGQYTVDNYELLGYHAECARKILNGGNIFHPFILDQKKANTVALRSALKGLLAILDDETE